MQYSSLLTIPHPPQTLINEPYRKHNLPVIQLPLLDRDHQPGINQLIILDHTHGPTRPLPEHTGHLRNDRLNQVEGLA